MAKSRNLDKYTNRAFATITMSAANTLTFEQVRFAVGLFQGVAVLIHAVHYYPDNNTVREIVAATDYCEFGLTLSNKITQLDPLDQSVLGLRRFTGIAAATEIFKNPVILDFSTMPEGGILVPANPIFMAMMSGGFAGAGLARAQIFFTFVQMADSDYLELLQTILPSNI